MYPGCLGNDCTSWGYRKATDGRTRSVQSLAHTSWGYFPYMQLDLGTNPPNVTAVRLVARADVGLWQSQNLDVFISATTNWTASTATLCRTGLTFAALGEMATVLCPTGYSWASRYVTVFMNSTSNRNFDGYFALQEIMPMYDGEPCCTDLSVSHVKDATEGPVASGHVRSSFT